MKIQDLEYFKNFFKDYTASFYGDDDYVNANLKLKENHTLRVCSEMVSLIHGLSLNAQQSLIAEAVALFHDIGRFPQFAQYRTFMDVKSENHSKLSLKVLQENNVLDRLSDNEAKIIRAAITLHNQKVLPKDLDEETTLFARLIRDADKIDIYYLAIKNYQEFESCPEGLVYEVDHTDKEAFSPDILDAIFAGFPISYHDLKTLNDVKLLQLGWVFDINFNPALRIIRQRRYLLQLLAMLPRKPQIAQLGQHIFKYIDSRLEEDN
jgi:hypothetical protein